MRAGRAGGSRRAGPAPAAASGRGRAARGGSWPRWRHRRPRRPAPGRCGPAGCSAKRGSLASSTMRARSASLRACCRPGPDGLGPAVRPDLAVAHRASAAGCAGRCRPGCRPGPAGRRRRRPQRSAAIRVWRSSRRVIRPRRRGRPPASFFAEHQQGGRLGQRLVLAVQLALELLDPAPVLPGLDGTGRPRLAQAGDGVVLPGLELGRVQPLLAAPGAAGSLVHRRRGDHRLQPRRRRPALAAGQRPRCRQGPGSPTLQRGDADTDLARDHVDGRALRRQQPRDDAVPNTTVSGAVELPICRR